MKRKLIFFPFDLFSHYLRCLQLADAVKEDFNILIAASADPKVNQTVRDRGFGVVECKTIDAARMSLMESRLDHSWLRQEELEPIFLDQVRVLREQRPDLVISDFSITLGMAAEYAQTTCYSLTIAHLSHFSRLARKAPEFHPGIKLAKKMHCPAWLLRLLTVAGESLEFRMMHKGLMRIRKKYSLGPRKDYFDELQAEQNLVTDIEDFSPMQALPGNYAYVGPVYHQHPGAEEELLSRLDPGKRTIFVSLGTFWSSDSLFALFNDPLFRDYNVVIAGKPGIELAPEIINKAFVNLDAVLPHADLLVCHGGDATVYPSLAHGVPLLGLAFHGEQTWSLQRAALLRFGEEIQLPMTASQMHRKAHYWTEARQREKIRFQAFAEKISLKSTQRRFRETLLHLNQRTFCSFCRRGTLESSNEIVNVPSDVQRYQNEYSTVWRCEACRSIHSLRILDLEKYYEDYPYDHIGNNHFVEHALRNLVKIVKSYGVNAGSSILFSGALSSVAREVFRRCGLTSFDILPRPTAPEGPWSFPEKRYDFIVLIECLDRVDDPFSYLRGVAKCLKSGGRVLIQSPDASRVDLNRLSAFKHELHQPYRLHLYSKTMFLRLAKLAGFELVDYQCQHFWDTLYPFVNQRLIHSLDKVTDGSVDATVSLPELKFARWWNLPVILFVGLFGGIFRKKSTMLAVFECPENLSVAHIKADTDQSSTEELLVEA
ncbi:methyltransferase domain-containing protein [Propionivibrio sp.]|uniref:methyltransferase domain-containing protein n=1 Tax=Propionivibrio sp. TaxID=2212460 RepID=UPI00262191B6|nr:methyltransferase domain-containing protein [Propionivibrio sp.]